MFEMIFYNMDGSFILAYSRTW